MHYLLRLLFLCSYGWVSALWLRTVARQSGPGPARLLGSVPVLLANILAPVLFDKDREVCTKAAIFLSFTWLGTFKVRDCTFQLMLCHNGAGVALSVTVARPSCCPWHRTWSS